MLNLEVVEFLGYSEKTLERYGKECKLSVRYEKIPGTRGKPKAVFNKEQVVALKQELSKPTYLSIPESVDNIAAGQGILSEEKFERIQKYLEAWGYSQYLNSLKQKLLLTTLEASAVSGLSVFAIRKAIKMGDLPALKFGNRFKISQEKLEIFVRGLEEGY